MKWFCNGILPGRPLHILIFLILISCPHVALAITFQITIQTNPDGLAFSVDGTAYTSTQVFTWDEGATHTLSVVSPQDGGDGVRFVFDSWSDGGAQSHTYTVPGSDQTVTADFKTQYRLTVNSPYGLVFGTGWYDAGSTATFRVFPGLIFTGLYTRHNFDDWTGAGPGSYSGDEIAASVTMNGPIVENANWRTRHYLLTSENPNAGGDMTPAPPGGWYDSGTVVTLDATVNAGYEWAGWSGDVSGNDKPTTLTMNEPKNVTANWTTVAQYYLSIIENPDQGGDVTPAPPGGTYPDGTVVPLTATATNGYVFTGWSGDLTGDANPTSITVDADKTVIANFAQLGLVTVNTIPEGLIITVDGTNYVSPQDFTWDPGSVHTIAVSSPQEGGNGVRYIYESWNDSGAQTHNITVNGPAIYTASFTTQYFLETAVQPGDGGSITPGPPGDWYNSGSNANIEAIPAQDYDFSEWSGDLTGDTNPTTITMDAPKSITAQFESTIRKVHVSAGTDPPGLEYSVNGTTYNTNKSFEFEVGSQITVSISTVQYTGQGSRYRLIGGCLNGACYYADVEEGHFTQTIEVPDFNASVIGVFQLEHELTVQSPYGNPQGAGWYEANTMANFHVTSPDIQDFTRYVFTQWTGDYSGSETSGSINMDGPKDVTAEWMTQYFLTMGEDPDEGGDVTPSPPGGWYDAGSHAALSADPNAADNYIFFEWTGDVTGDTNPTTIEMDGPKAVTAHFRRVGQIRITTNPEGLTVTVDGTDYVSPQDFMWDSGSNHTIGVPSPQWNGNGVRTIYQSWSDEGEQTHDITVNGIAEYTAILMTQYFLETSIDPAGGGDVIPAPPGDWYDHGSLASIEATPAQDYVFFEWTGDVTGDTNPTSIEMDGPKAVTAHFRRVGQIRITTNPEGLTVTVDGTDYVSPQDFMWDSGSNHTIGVPSPQGNGNGVRTIYQSWSDEGAQTHDITVNGIAEYTAILTTQFFIETSMDPAGGGDVIPAPPGDWYDHGSLASIEATPAQDYVFFEWTGDVTGDANPTTIEMDGPKHVTAVFEEVGEGVSITVRTNPPGLLYSVDGVEYNSKSIFYFPPGSTHQVGLSTFQYPEQGTRYRLIGGCFNEQCFYYEVEEGSFDLPLTIPEYDVSITLNFLLEYELIIQSPHGNPQGTGWYEANTSADFVVTSPDVQDLTRHVLTQWTGDYLGSEPRGSLIMDSPKHVTAIWTTEYFLTTVAKPDEGGDVTPPPPGGWYTAGANVPLTATPNRVDNYIFSGWGGDMTGDVNPTSIDMDGPKRVVAHFSNDMLSLTLIRCYPPHNASAIPVNTDIMLKVIDSNGDSGVDKGSIHVFVNGTSIVQGGIDLTGGRVSITSHSPSYTVYYDPVTPFPAGIPVAVRVQADDLSSSNSALDSTYTFLIGQSIKTETKTDTVPPHGGIMVDSTSGIIMTIPEGALSDTTRLTIGTVESPPGLPDSVVAFGLVYHFWPDGLRFNDPVSIQIPYHQADLDSAGVADPLDLQVYYYSTTEGRWIRLGIVYADQAFITVEVDAFCYLRLCRVPIPGSVNDYADDTKLKDFFLYQNHPNPFNPETVIRYHIPEYDHVRLEIYNLKGQSLKVLVDEPQAAGSYDVVWNGRDEMDRLLGSGVYLYVLRYSGYVKRMKALFVR